MIKLERNMTVNATVDNNGFRECQASLNSDGNITLRNYNSFNKNNDEIIILSSAETEALFRLFSQIGRKNQNYDLPF